MIVTPVGDDGPMEVLTSVEPARVEALRARDEFFWVDLHSPPPADLERLGDILHFHPAAVEDTREWEQLPKVDVYGDHLLLVFFTAEGMDPRSEPREVHVYVSGGWLVTVRRCDSPLDALHAPMRAAEPDDEEDHLV